MSEPLNFVTFSDNVSKIKIAILSVKPLNKNDLLYFYINPVQRKLSKATPDKYIAIQVPEVKADQQREFLVNNVFPDLRDIQANTLIVTDRDLFKRITGEQNVKFGYRFKCNMPNFENFWVIPTLNYQAVYFNPNLINKINLVNRTILDHLNNEYKPIESSHVKNKYYVVNDLALVKKTLRKLLKYPALTCDIEDYSLKHYECEGGTISFSWDKYNGVCIDISHLYKTEGIGTPDYKNKVLALLKGFFIAYKGNLKYHNANYDIKVLIYLLFMTSITDTKGLHKGIEVMTRNFDCTRVRAYISSNSATGNFLSLKEQAYEFLGDYGLLNESNKIIDHKTKELMEYNIHDTCGTWYVWEKHSPLIPSLEKIYNEFKKYIVDIIEVELTGLPVCMDTVRRNHKLAKQLHDDAVEKIRTHSKIKEVEVWLCKKHAATKVKKTYKDYLSNPKFKFNQNSPTQLKYLISDILGYELTVKTPKGNDSLGKDVYPALISQSRNKEDKELFEGLLDLSKVSNALKTFFPALLRSVKGPDNHHYMFGNFKLGGCVSGRLSSNDPNLQNLPSHGWLGKLIKECIVPPKGWVLVYLDFDALEAKATALWTKDPNRLDVYIKGFDSHCFNAYFYFMTEVVGIEFTVESVNSIKQKYPELRNRAKPANFSLSYEGTAHTLRVKGGFSEEDSERIYAQHHETYKVTAEAVRKRLQQASLHGYVDVAFGLRIQTPLLKGKDLSVNGIKRLRGKIAKEYRTVANALGQSYGLLNSRAFKEFRFRRFKSRFKEHIRPWALIHDASYYMIKPNPELLHWFNINLVECIEWQELPELKHPSVKLSGQVTLCYPSWAKEIDIPNRASLEQITEILNNLS